MNCNELEVLLADFLQGGLSAEQRPLVEAHLKECANCQADAELWRRMGEMPVEQPSPMLRQRFDAMMDAFEQGQWEQMQRRTNLQPASAPRFGGFFSLPFAQAAAALVLVLGGFMAGLYMDRNNAGGREMDAMRAELTSTRSELRGTRQLVALSMMQQQSASDRLQGVSYSTRIEKADPEVLNALLHTLRYDNSVDVRMAALDALRRYNDQPIVRTGVLDSLKTQQSPLVQIALVDYMVELKDRKAVENLKDFEKDPNLNPVVKQRVQWGITQLTKS